MRKIAPARRLTRKNVRRSAHPHAETQLVACMGWGAAAGALLSYAYICCCC